MMQELIQLIALLVMSGFALKLFAKKSLFALGWNPPGPWKYLAILLVLITAFSAALNYLLRIVIAHEEYILDSKMQYKPIAWAIWQNIRSVLTEELMFRGALLYILLQRIGIKSGLLISAALFAGFHWLDIHLWSRPMELLMITGFTFLMGLVLAGAFVRTGTIWLPILIHLAWNLVQHVLFPGMPGSPSVFILAAEPPEVTISYFALFILMFLPKIIVLAVNAWILWRQKPMQ